LKKKERNLPDKPLELKRELPRPPESLLRPKERSLLPWKLNRRLTMRSRDLRKREEPRHWLRRRLKRKLLKLRRKPERRRPRREKEELNKRLLN
jgi:hypothetical protein